LLQAYREDLNLKEAALKLYLTAEQLDPSSTVCAARLLRNPHKTYICGCAARKCSATSLIIRA
jgi:hypothetical protein